jgi:cobalt-zinc-cadmium efflux system outer membrane protein
MWPGRSLVWLGLFAWALLDPARAAAQAHPAGGELLVDDLVTRALTENLELRAARAEVDAAKGRLQQAGLRPNPMLDLGGQQNVTGPDHNVMVGLTVPLDLNGRKAGRVAVAERELELKRAQIAERERRLRAEVRLKAGEVLAAARNLRFMEELLDINRQALTLLQERVRTGAAPPLEGSLLLVEVNRLDAGRRSQESRLQVLTLQLRAMVNVEPETPLSVNGDLSDVIVASPRDQGVERALEGRPDLGMARADLGMARARIQKEEADGRWDASVNVGYQRQDFGFPLNGLTDRGGTRPIQDVFHMVGGGLTITLPVRNRNQGNVAASVAEATAAERRLEFMRLVIRQEVAAAYTQHAAAQQSLEIYARGVRDVARQNLDVVRQSYQLGRVPLLDVIAEQRRYIEIETGYTDSLKQVYDGAVEIERAIGTPTS